MRSNDNSVAAASARNCGVWSDVPDDDEDGLINAREWKMSHSVVNRQEFFMSQSRVARSASSMRSLKRFNRRCRRPSLDEGAMPEDDGPTAAAVEKGVADDEEAAKA